MKMFRIHRKKIKVCSLMIFAMVLLLVVRLAYIVIFESEELSEAAKEVQERERYIKAARGQIISSDGTVLADNITVCTVSVIYSQIENKEEVISVLAKELEMSEEKVRARVEKYSSREVVKTNVAKETGDRIRSYNLSGVKVDDDCKRVYPYYTLASKVLGFTGSENQGIIGLEVEYDSILTGENGKIITLTDSKGIEFEQPERREEPVSGKDLYITLDYNIQSYCMQAAIKTYEAKKAKSVSIIVMNPQDGSIYAMVNYPEYNLNEPFKIEGETEGLSDSATMELLNKKWRNGIINDTYEPGSTFKIITATAGLETGALTVNNTFSCSGTITVGGRSIRCHKTTGHGHQTFAETLMNSCNPAFITWGAKVGVDDFLVYMNKLGLMEKTGVDIPGEASTIMHSKENIHELELATISFGQSFQITPLQLLRAVSCVINGGNLVTPHFADKYVDSEGKVTEIEYSVENNVISTATCDTMKELLELVVSEGGGSKCAIEGYSIGGKTATSQKLPRGNGKYIASFIGFAPVDEPKVVAMCLIDEPEGVYYGGTIAAPVIKDVFENILPYLEIEQELD